MKFLISIAAAVLLVAIIVPTGCGPKSISNSTHDGPMVRVRLLAGVDRVNLGLSEAPIIDVGGSRRRLGVRPGQTVVLTYTDTGWMINGIAVGQGPMVIEPATAGSVTCNGLPYRGSYRFVPLAAGRFDVVNDLDVDSYLLGVLSRELLPDWDAEAYKAQAVIARTYAIYEVKTGAAGRHWDLHPDERSQVYGGMNAETDRSRAGVDATRGMVVAWGARGDEKIFKAYFSACCGGVGASVGDVFGETTIPPLDAKYTGNTCSIAGRYNWGPIGFAKSELTRRIRAWGAKNGHALANLSGLQTIEISGTNQFHRPRRFTVTDTNGLQSVLTSEQMRWAINADPQGGPTVFSSFFRPVDTGDAIQLVEGHGFGHGAGACQWCMQARALSGSKFEQIVLEAYPQSTVLSAY
ncbi:MAG: SpoIID/LytB domain-containing protein [Burkholderiales bacterium]|nr:SpoIID/LytB domain-containing protein [Phycisphaerae bacterium]